MKLQEYIHAHRIVRNGPSGRPFVGSQQKKILSALATGPSSTDQIAARLNLPVRNVCHSLARLRNRGMVTMHPANRYRGESYVWEATLI
jgi:predicted Rossmann fold nucleotide-binding protein DprA/Smf involved in DNA uptake